MEREGSVRIPAGCAIAALISKEGRMIAGDVIIRGIATMHDRSNGLGGGFAAYGIYPEHRDQYALHIFFDNKDRRSVCEGILRERFEVVRAERIPTRRIPAITDEPLIWRYFVSPLRSVLAAAQQDEEEYMIRTVTKLNAELSGCYVFSCGKNMGIFKAVGFPEDVGTFYRLEEYKAYSWTAHGRYPTNTPGWWGGAHPFGLLDRTIVHNGEISSYDANRRFIEKCTAINVLCSLKEATNYTVPIIVKVAAVHNIAAITSGIARSGADIIAIDGFRGGTGGCTDTHPRQCRNPHRACPRGVRQASARGGHPQRCLPRRRRKHPLSGRCYQGDCTRR